MEAEFTGTRTPGARSRSGPVAAFSRRPTEPTPPLPRTCHFLAFRIAERSVLTMRVLGPITLATSLLAGGCTLASMTPQARFSESAYMLNDYARWGQVDAAMTHVSPKYMQTFSERHREWGDRVNVIDLRLAKILRFGRTRTNVGVDVYNLFNSSAVLNYNQSYNPVGTWLVPTTVVAGRFAKISATLDF